MNPLEAKLLLADETAIDLLIAEHADPRNAVKAALLAVQSVPGAIRNMSTGLADIVADPNLEFKEGTFHWVGDANPTRIQEVMEKGVRFFSSSDSAGNMGRWILGNLAAIAEEQMGEDWLHLFDGTELAYNTIVTSKTTFQFFKDKRYQMPFSHHKEIAYAKDLSDAQKHLLAAYVADSGLTLTTARGIMRLMQDQIKTGQTVEAPADLHEKIDTTPRAGKQFLIIENGGDRRVSDRAPAGAEVEEAEGIYEIRRIIKDAGRGRPQAAPEPVREDGPRGEPGEPGEG